MILLQLEKIAQLFPPFFQPYHCPFSRHSLPTVEHCPLPPFLFSVAGTTKTLDLINLISLLEFGFPVATNIQNGEDPYSILEEDAYGKPAPRY
jgi:hypothetical protein